MLLACRDRQKRFERSRVRRTWTVTSILQVGVHGENCTVTDEGTTSSIPCQNAVLSFTIPSQHESFGKRPGEDYEGKEYAGDESTHRYTTTAARRMRGCRTFVASEAILLACMRAMV